MIKMDRSQGRQELVKSLFQQYINRDRASDTALHQFCKWAADKSRLEIERDLNNPNGNGFWS